MKATPYFERRRKDRPYLQDVWIEEALNKPIHVEIQPDGRRRHYVYVAALGKYLRVVFEGEMVHNAFIDSGFSKKWH